MTLHAKDNKLLDNNSAHGASLDFEKTTLYPRVI